MTTCDPTALIAAATCLDKVIPRGRMAAAQVVLACSWAQNSQGSTPAPPAPAFSYTPASAIISWTDKNVNDQLGDLAYFVANADIPSVDEIDAVQDGVTSFSNLSSLPALETMTISGNNIPSLVLDGCVSLISILATSNLLTSVSISGCSSLNGLNVVANKLPVAMVNSILETLVSLGNLNGTVDTSGQTPPAPPSGAGITAFATLVARGWTVNTD